MPPTNKGGAFIVLCFLSYNRNFTISLNISKRVRNNGILSDFGWKSEMTSYNDEEEGKMQKLLRWAAELGISDAPYQLQKSQVTPSCLGQSLLISNFPNAGGRGLAAARDLRVGELILRVPKQALISCQSINDTMFLDALKKYPKLGSSQILVIYLLFEVSKRKRSAWYDYIQMLPHVYFLLATFSDFEAEALQFLDAVVTANSIRNTVYNEWKESHLLMKEVGLNEPFISFKSWLWAFSTVSSRTLHVPWDNAGCLCPIGDFFNYAAPADDKKSEDSDDADQYTCNMRTSNGKDIQKTTCVDECVKPNDCSVHIDIKACGNAGCHSYRKRLTDAAYDENLSAYCFYARENYKTGEQVLLCYGQYTNLELLEHYGFLLGDNQSDKIFLDLEEDMWGMALRYWEREQLYIQWDGVPSFALLAALRLHLAPTNVRKRWGHLAFSGLSISVQNDLSVMRWLQQKCSVLISTTPTTVTVDETLIGVIENLLEMDGIQSLLNLVKKFQTSNHSESVAMLELFSSLPSLSLSEKNYVTRELKIFFQTHCCQLSKYSNLHLEKCIVSYLFRWKLAIQWRMGHKKALHFCVSYCRTEIINLSKQNKVDEEAAS